ncbi:MAG: hypothetical protein KC684_02495 [Candidatus Omnitrophica bacterium]|nr:hypothetical protein [Candidatus Omnitrophota bacterium]
MLLKSYNKNIDVFSFNEKDGRVERKVENFNDEDVVGSFFETVDGKKSLFYREGEKFYYQRGKLKICLSSSDVKSIYFRFLFWEFFFLLEKNQMKETRFIKSSPAVLKGVHDPTYDELDKSNDYFFYNVYKVANDKDE